MPTRKYLILSSVMHYGREQLQPFVASWRRHVPDSDLVLMADQISQETVAWLRENGVKVVPASYSLFKVGTGRKRTARHFASDAATSLFCSLIHRTGEPGDDRPERIREAMLDLYGSRFIDYLRFLRLFGNDYSHVLMVDCRDSVFQDSPFPCEGLHSFGENDTIGGSLSAQRWFRLTYGLKTWRQFASHPFLCAGVILGDTPSIIALLELLMRECRKVLPNRGEDQAVYNYIVHSRLMPATVHPFGEGAAINLHMGTNLNIVEGRLLNAEYHVIAVVHQYDRIEGLADKLSAFREG
jgi:hypothetical protein